MNARLLIDAIVRQTTVLIAQLSTAAGIRAPLAHIADQVFLELSREIESHGVSRKVAADMFGLAIRTYQKKVQRLTESATVRDRTLWEAVLSYLQEHGTTSRRELLAHFGRDDPMVVGSVLNDLVSSGILYKTGSGESAIFGVTNEPDLAQALREQGREALVPIVWVFVYRSGGIEREALEQQLPVDAEALDEALATLEAQGQVERTGQGDHARYRASTFRVPVGAEHGWEAAVFDHFQAVVRAIGCKVSRGRPQSAHDDVVGGATLTFDVSAEHPYREQVLGLLQQVRTQVNELWNQVQRYNEQHPILEESRTEVSFYFGQSLASHDDD
jgi:hypothetical protein